MADKIINSFDVWITAQGLKSRGRLRSIENIRLEGIDQLRQLILNLATTGKLVDQDPNDEPAEVLLRKIELEKKRLIEEGSAPKQRELPEINDQERTLSVPKNWVWARLGTAGFTTTGKTPSTNRSDFFDGDIPFIGPGQISDTGDILEAEKSLSEEGSEYSSIAKLGDILMVCIGGSIGKTAIVDRVLTFNQQINCISPILMHSCYLNFAMNSQQFQKRLVEKATGSATPIINKGKWEELLITIPPLAEQHRIVAKVDELMAICDELEKQETYHLKSHQLLVETLLGTLTHANDAAEFETAWSRLAQNFDEIFTTENSIDQLKQTILQLAVMGKLVPQDPNDEPAGELLKRIRKEKLAKVTKTKKAKPVSESKEGQRHIGLPFGWAWAKLEEFTFKITDGEHFRPETQNHGIYFLSAKDIKEDGVSLDDPLFISSKTAEKALERCDPEKGDILIVSRGATVGRSCVVDIDEVFCLLGSVILIKPVKLIESKYLELVMKSPEVFRQLVSASGSTAQPAIYLRDLKKIDFPIAPLREQNRIVRKVAELFALCDRLKERISESQKTSNELANSVLNLV